MRTKNYRPKYGGSRVNLGPNEWFHNEKGKSQNMTEEFGIQPMTPENCGKHKQSTIKGKNDTSMGDWRKDLTDLSEMSKQNASKFSSEGPNWNKFWKIWCDDKIPLESRMAQNNQDTAQEDVTT